MTSLICQTGVLQKERVIAIEKIMYLPFIERPTVERLKGVVLVHEPHDQLKKERKSVGINARTMYSELRMHTKERWVNNGNWGRCCCTM